MAEHALRFERNTDPQVWVIAGWSPRNRPLGWWASCRCGWRQWFVQQSDGRTHYRSHAAAWRQPVMPAKNDATRCDA